MDAMALTVAIGASSAAALGWSGNAFYFSRFVVQWWQSERAQRSVAPKVFWWLSLAGAATLGTYALIQGDTPLFVGYVVTFFIYLRNITIAHLGPRAGRLGPGPAMAVALTVAATVVYFGAVPGAEEPLPPLWLAIGFAGQVVFSSRFIVQWFHSERAGDAHFPPVFWWMSLVGNVALLAYAVRRGDPVFIAGFALGPFVQVRNLMLVGRARREARGGAGD